MKSTMIGVTVHNFRSFAFSQQTQAAKPFAHATVGLAPHKNPFGTHSPYPTWNTKDEFTPTEQVSSATFKRPVAHKHAPTVESPPKQKIPVTETEKPDTGNHETASPVQETKFTPSFEQSEEMNRLLLAIAQVFADNGVELKEDDVITVTLSKDGIFFIDANESSVGGVTGEELGELCTMLSEKLNEAGVPSQIGDEETGVQTLGNALKQVTEQVRESVITQYAEESGSDPEEIKDKEFSFTFSFGFNPETEQNEILGLKLHIQDIFTAQIKPAEIDVPKTDQSTDSEPGDRPSLTYQGVTYYFDQNPSTGEARPGTPISFDAQNAMREQMQHLSESQLAQFEKSLLEKYNPEVEINVGYSAEPTLVNGKFFSGGIKTVRTGDTGLTAAQQSALDKATLAKAYELWAADRDPNKIQIPLAEEESQPPSNPTTDTEPLPLENVITSTIVQRLGANGIQLKAGDYVALKLNGMGEFSIDEVRTRIDGIIGEELRALCSTLSDQLKETFGENKAWDNEMFGEFTQKFGLNYEHVDLEKNKDDPDFSLMFHIRHDSETEESEMVKVIDLAKPFHRESFFANGGIMTTDKEGNVFIAPGLQQFNKDDLAANFDSEPWNAYNFAARHAAVSQWERDNDFYFWRANVEGAPPMTQEEKQHYNAMLMKALSEGIQPLQGFRSSLNIVDGTNWMIADGAEALIGHDILHWLENGMLANGERVKSGGHVNEYGFSIDIPGTYSGASYLHSDLVSPELQKAEGLDMVYLNWANEWVKGIPSYPLGYGDTKRVPVPGIISLPGGHAQTFAPEISFHDAVGLGGMSLADRKLFLDKTQKILDEVLPGMNARDLKFSTGQLTLDDVRNNTFSLTLDVPWLTNEQRDTIQGALNKDRQLVEMKLRADASGNKGLGEFTISVLDAQGNALANDQVRLISGSKSVVTSLEAIKDMDQQQIFAFIGRG